MIQSQETTIIERIYSYEIAHILQQRINNQWIAQVQYSVFDQFGNQKKSIVLTYEGEEYNNWFKNYNSGEFIIQELLDKKEIKAEIPKDIEENFVNKIQKTEETEFPS